MNIGILYNTFVCLITGLVGFMVFLSLSKKRKKKEEEISKGLDYFSLFSALLWFASGVGTFSNWINRPEIGRTIYKYFTGPLVYIHLVPAFNYFGWSFFKESKKTRQFFNSLFIVISAIAVVTLALYGFQQPEMSYWGANVVPNDLANNIFIFGLFLPGLVCIMVELGKRVRRWNQKNNLENKRRAGLALGYFLYALAGVFDALGSAQAWMTLVARSGVMVSFLIFYFFVTLEE